MKLKMILSKMVRRFVFAAIASLLSLTTFSQTVQQGIVKEYKEKVEKTPLSGVTIKVLKAGSTVSDKNGKFSLNFVSSKPGDGVTVSHIEKPQYEIFNKDILDQWNINPNRPFEIVLCQSKLLQKIKENYKKVATSSYERQLAIEKAKVKKLKEEGRLKDEEYSIKLTEIEDEYFTQLKNLNNYIDRFSRIDLSQLSSKEQEIIELVKLGQIDEAIKKYEEQEYLKKYTEAVSDVDELSAGIEKMTETRRLKMIEADSLLAVNFRYIDALMLAGGRENNEKVKVTLIELANRNPDNISILLKTAHYIQEYFGDYKLALKYGEKALDKVLNNSEKDLRLIGEVYNLLGIIYSDLAKYEESKNCYIKALEIWDNPNFDDVFARAYLYLNIGSLCEHMQDFEKAQSYYESVLDLYTACFDASDPRFISVFNGIGSVKTSLGQYSEALDWYVKALDIIENEEDSRSEDYNNIYNNVALIHKKLENYDKAIFYYNKSLDLTKEKYGEFHPSVAITCDNMGSLYQSMGMQYESSVFHLKAITIFNEIYDGDHPEVAVAYANIGGLMQDWGKYDSALDYYKKALTIDERIFGEHSNRVATDLDNIGSSLIMMGKVEASINLRLSALSIFENFYQGDHPDIITTLANLGYSYRIAEMHGEALRYYDKAMEMSKRMYGPTHPEVAYLYEAASEVLTDHGDFEHSLAFLSTAFNMKKEAYGLIHPSVAKPLDMIGDVYSKMNDFNSAVEYYEMSGKIYDKYFGAMHRKTAQCFYSTALTYDLVQNYEKAYEYYTKCMAPFCKIYGEDGLEVSEIHQNIGWDSYMMGNVDEAVASYVKAIDIKEKLVPEEDKRLQLCYKVLGLLYMTKGDIEKSQEFQNKCKI